MAEGKKSFILYLQQRSVFDGLDDAEAGKLIKTIFSYVCDENPQPTGLTKYAFEIVKPVLKADLKKYEEKKEKYAENVRKRWNKDEKENIQSNTIVYNGIQSDSVNVNDNVNVNVNDNVLSKDNVNNISVINNTCSKSDLNGGVNEDKFNRFWSEYPRKVGKDKCQKWFKAHKVTDELLNKMLDTISKFKQSKGWLKDNGQYIPHPYTWLNRGGWEDEIEEERHNNSSIDVEWEELPPLTDEDYKRLGLIK